MLRVNNIECSCVGGAAVMILCLLITTVVSVIPYTSCCVWSLLCGYTLYMNQCIQIIIGIFWDQ